MSEINKEVLEDDEAYLIVPQEHAKVVATPDTVWAKIDDEGKLRRVLPKVPAATRQELPICFEINGAIYAVSARWFRQALAFVDDETLAYVMPRERSIDVDTPEDLAIAEFLLR